jgi:hypothetical protein
MAFGKKPYAVWSENWEGKRPKKGRKETLKETYAFWSENWGRQALDERRPPAGGGGEEGRGLSFSNERKGQELG